MWARFVGGCILIVISFLIATIPFQYLSRRVIGIEIVWVYGYIFFAAGLYLVASPFKDFYAEERGEWLTYFILGSALIISSIVIGFVPSFTLLSPGVQSINPIGYWTLSFSLLVAGFYVIIKPFIIIRRREKKKQKRKSLIS